jgi:hypothetical protein
MAQEVYKNLFTSPKSGCTLCKNILVPLLKKYRVRIFHKTLIARDPTSRLVSYFTGGLIRLFHDNQKDLNKLGIYIEPNHKTNVSLDDLYVPFTDAEMIAFHKNYASRKQFNADYIVQNVSQQNTCQLTFEDVLNGLLKSGANNCEWHLQKQTLNLGNIAGIKIFTIKEIKENPRIFCDYLKIPFEEYAAGFENAASSNKTSYSDMGDVYLGNVQILRLVQHRINPKKKNLINEHNENLIREIYREDFELLERFK